MSSSAPSAAGAYVRSTSQNPRVQHRDESALSLTVTQPLFTGFQTVSATDAAEYNVQGARARLANVEQSVLLSGVTAFMNVVRDRAIVELNINNEQVLQRQLEATRDRFSVGEVTRTDVAQVEARLASAVATRIASEGQLDVSRANYRNLIGDVPGALVPPPPPTDIPASRDAALDQSLTRNPNVVAASYDERAALSTVRQITGELLPSVNLQGTASRAFNTTAESVRNDDLEALVVLTVPLYQQGATYARIRAAKQTVLQADQLLNQARRSALENATSAWESMDAARAQITSLEAQVEASQIALEGVQREAQVGSRTVLDVLNAEQELLNARVSLVTARRDLIVASYTVKSAIGELLAQNLNLSVDYYDPSRHYLEVRDRWVGTEVDGDYEAIRARNKQGAK